MRLLKRLGLVLAVLVVLGGALGVFALRHAGYRAYVVHTGSMTPTYPPGDLIVDRSPEQRYRAGDVITFHHDAGPDLVSHRITDVTDGAIHTKGDGNRSADVWDIRPDQVVGVTVGALSRMGYLVVFMQQPTGVAGVMCAGLSLVLLWGLFFPTREPS